MKNPISIKIKGEGFLDSHVMPGDIVIFGDAKPERGDLILLKFETGDGEIAYFSPTVPFAAGVIIEGVGLSIVRDLKPKKWEIAAP